MKSRAKSRTMLARPAQLARPASVIIRASEAAELLGVNSRTVRRWILSGELRGRCVCGRWYVVRQSVLLLCAADIAAALD